jgi:hypothetical protein
VADHLEEFDTVHVMRYSTPFSFHLGRTSSRPPNQPQPVGVGERGFTGKI